MFTNEINEELEFPYNVQVHDISGVLVSHTESINGNRIVVKLIESQAGLYIAKILSRNHLGTFKINCL